MPTRSSSCGGVPVAVSCPENNHFHLRAADLEAAITSKTKWVVLNFPNNPTGAVCTRDEMREIADVLLQASARADHVGRDLRAPRL